MINDLDILIFDVDDTLVQRWTTNLLRNRAQRLKDLRDKGTRIFLATNQGGPAYHAWHFYRKSGRAGEYPTLIKTIGMMTDITKETGAKRCYVALHPGAEEIAAEVFAHMTTEPDQVMYLMGDKVRASYRAGWRKPAPGMLLEIMEETGAEHGRCAYVGNETRDMLTAEAAGIRSIEADEFFYGEWSR